MVSGKARSGKDTFVDFFIKNSSKYCRRFAFADPLKEMAKELYGWNGEKTPEGRGLLIDVGQIGRGVFGIEHLNDRMLDSEIFGLGADRIYQIKERFNVFKKYFTPSSTFWSDILYKNLLLKSNHLDHVLISDWRFQSEYYAMMLYLGRDAITKIRIHRDVPIIDDISEKDLDTFTFDYHIDNKEDGLDIYEDKVINFMKEYC